MREQVPLPIRISQAMRLAKRMDLLGTEGAFEVLARARRLEADGRTLLAGCTCAMSRCRSIRARSWVWQR